MRNDDLRNMLKGWGILNADAYRDIAFSRNIGLFSPGEQERLATARVAIPGMGGVGGAHLVNLVRTGIGRFNLADFDRFEPLNVNRQFGATVHTFGGSKLDVMIGEALAVNPFLDITSYPEGLTAENLETFLAGVDVVLDGLDFFQFDIRRTLFNTARSMGVPVITAGPLGFSSALLVFTPEGMGFDDYFDVSGNMPEEDKYLRFAMGLAPRPTHIGYMDLARVDLKDGKGPSLNIACQLCASLAGTEAVRIILGRPGLRPAPYFLQFDPFLRRLRGGCLRRGNRAPTQRAKLWFVRSVLLKAAAGARPTEPSLPGRPEGPGLSPATLDYLVRAAVQAPSGDNAQPWKFRVDGENLEVHLDHDADSSFFNVRQTASVIACGAAVENVVLAAGALGLDARPALLPDPARVGLMASVRLEPGSSPADPLSRYLWTRNTNRRPFSTRALPDWTKDDLRARIKDPSVNLHLLEGRGRIRKLARIIYLADRIRTEHQGLHEHFTSMVRFDQKEALSRRDGLPLPNLEAGAAGDIFLRLTKPWWAMRAANTLGMGRMVAMHSAMGILNSGAAGLLTVEGMDPRDFLVGGRALQRVWLAMEHHGLQMQPMTAVTLFWLRWLWDGPESFSARHQALLEKVWAGFRELFPETDFHTRGLVMLFRVGYGPAIRHRTLRREPGDFLRP